MPQFCSLFYAILQSWRPKGGAMAQCPPLYTPLLLMHDWKKLLIASHYVNDRTQKLDYRNYAYFANSVLFFQVNLKT